MAKKKMIMIADDEIGFQSGAAESIFVAVELRREVSVADAPHRDEVLADTPITDAGDMLAAQEHKEVQDPRAKHVLEIDDGIGFTVRHIRKTQYLADAVIFRGVPV